MLLTVKMAEAPIYVIWQLFAREVHSDDAPWPLAYGVLRSGTHGTQCEGFYEQTKHKCNGMPIYQELETAPEQLGRWCGAFVGHDISVAYLQYY